MKKRLLAALMTLVMATSLIPTAAFADMTENGSSDAAKVTIAKTATNLVKEGEDYQTTVTLSVGSTEETIGSDVVFVLDKSTSTDVRKAALDMLGELKNRVDAGNTIKVGIVVFNKTASVQTDLIELRKR